MVPAGSTNGVATNRPNPLAGVISLTFYSIGYLGKFFSDAFESIDTAVTIALRSAGADRIQAFQYAMLPQVKPLIASHILWMLEYNIRSAAIVGYVGAVRGESGRFSIAIRSSGGGTVRVRFDLYSASCHDPRLFWRMAAWTYHETVRKPSS